MSLQITETVLANIALGHLGESKIVDIDERTPQAERCRLQWPLVRDALLRMRDWSFARRQATLTALPDAPPFGFAVAYQLPQDYICLRKLNCREANAGGSRLDVIGQELHCNDSTAQILYTARIETVTLWDSSFCTAFSLLLAAAIAAGITNATSLAERLQKRGEEAALAAFLPNAHETQPRAIMPWQGSGYLAARHGACPESYDPCASASSTPSSSSSSGGGSVTSVALSGGTTGLTVSGSPITGSGTITLSGTLALAHGGTGATTAAGARTALELGTLALVTPTGTPTGSKFLRDDNVWTAIPGGGDALVANPLSQFAATTSAQLRGVLSDETGTGAAYFQGGDAGTPSAIVLTNGTGLPVASGISGLGTNVATALAVNVGSAGAFVVLNGAGGTPSSLTLTNATGLPLTTGVTGTLPVANGGTGITSGTSGGVLAFTAAGTIASSGALAANAIVIGGGAGAAPSTTTTGTGVLTALGVNVGSAGAFITFDGAAGTPSSITLTNGTGLPISTGVSGLGANVATFLATPSSANLAAAVTGETGSGALVFATNPTFPVAINIGVAAADTGSIALIGASSGVVTVTVSAAAGSWTLTLPTTDGDANQFLMTNGSGVTSWSGVPVGSITGLGTGVATALAVNVGSAGAPVINGGALGTPSSGTLTNCTGLPASGIAAGVLGGNITLGESTGQIILDPTLSADGTWSGIMQAGTAGATLAFGDLVYFAVADSRWELADADADATAGAVLLGICVLAAAADGDPTNILLYGKVRADAAFPSLTVGAPVYVSTTAGDIQVAQPSGTDDVIRVVGHALTADVLLFNPSQDWITHT
jgi:hypothetical protein